MSIDFDKLKYSLTGEYEEHMLEKQLEEYKKSDYILNGLFQYLDEKQDEYLKKAKPGHYITTEIYNFINEIKSKTIELSKEYDKENDK